jgi:hypothetical protein
VVSACEISRTTVLIISVADASCKRITAGCCAALLPRPAQTRCETTEPLAGPSAFSHHRRFWRSALRSHGFLLRGRLCTSRPLPYASAFDALRPARAAVYASLRILRWGLRTVRAERPAIGRCRAGPRPIQVAVLLRWPSCTHCVTGDGCPPHIPACSQ